jgi:S1-C subfamily serine protease
MAALVGMKCLFRCKSLNHIAAPLQDDHDFHGRPPFTNASIGDEMKSVFSGLIVFVILALAPLPSHANTNNSIVKIFTTSVTYNYDYPWATDGISNATGSGSLISNNRILTNAHLVSNSTFIQVMKNGDSKKYSATVLAVSHDADLALLGVDDESFWTDAVPLELGALPELRDKVSVYGFPEGGEGLSITQGIISRVEVTQYVHSKIYLLGLQIDAAINSGNSGGPVIMEDKIIGVAMQSLEQAENIGYIIPVPIIEHFLVDLEDGQYDGFPDDGVLAQTLENETFRNSLELPDDEAGVYVAVVVPGSSSAGYLKPGDVVLEIDGHSVASNGSVLLRPDLRVQANYIVNDHQLGEELSVRIWRDGKALDLSIPLTSKCGDNDLVKLPEYDMPPEYYIFAGIIFSPLTQNYLETWGTGWKTNASPALLRYFFETKKVPNEEVVLVNGFLSADINTGYQNGAEDNRVISVNGQGFASFKEFVSLIEAAIAKDTLVTLKTEDDVVLVLSPAKHKAIERALLDSYGIEAPKNVR